MIQKDSEEDRDQTPAMSHYLSLLLECPMVIAAIFITGIGGTFQYGFSVAVLTSPSDFIKELVNNTCQQRYGLSLEQWQVSLIWSFTVSIFCIGGLLGSLLVSPLIYRYGRKQCLLFNNFLAISGALLMLFSQKAMSFEMIMVGRLLFGINAGIGFSTHPTYLIECAPKKLRGMVGVTISTFISLGKFSAQLLGISELLGTEQRWPWLLAFTGLAALLQLSTLPFLPESPHFLLLNRGDREACDKAMKRLWGHKDYTWEMEEMMKEVAATQSVHNHSVMELIQNREVRWQLVTVLITFTAVQLCGNNAVYFYSFDVFRAAGIQEGQLRYAALGTGLCEVTTSITCFMIIERMQKKVLLVGGYMAMSVTLVLLTVTLYLQSHVSWMPYCSMVLIFVFIFCFACGPSGVTAPLPAELFTEPFKSAAYTLACALNWTSLFVLGMFFPVLVDKLGVFCFLIFLFFCLVCGLFVKFNVPETKHKTALEIAADFKRMHCKSNKQSKEHGDTCETRF